MDHFLSNNPYPFLSPIPKGEEEEENKPNGSLKEKKGGFPPPGIFAVRL